MAKILSVSYDGVLLDTRHQILSARAGYSVTSARGFAEALQVCSSDQQFDLFIVGHSIPHSDKEALIQAFRAQRSTALVVVLKLDWESAVAGADMAIEPSPHELLKSVANLLSGRGTAA